jgi:hypothetical protein
MRRGILAVVTATMLLVPSTALADPGGDPNDAGDCGLGKSNAALAITLPEPGASDFATISPHDPAVLCTGKP